MYPIKSLRLALMSIAVACSSAAMSQAGPVNLGSWTAESYPAVSGFSAGVWTTSLSGDSVTQSVNGQPTLFYSDFNAFNTDVQGQIRVNTLSDDDYIGFALGFHSGNSSNSAADYLLIDWKKETQFFNFGSPSNTPGSTALKGLAVSRVTGVPTADEFWGHTNFPSNASGGVVELARGNTLGSTGWATGTTYGFRFIFTPLNLQVFVNDTLEIDVSGNFSDGRLAFYNFSQADVTYSTFTLTPTLTPIPEPSTLILAGLGVFGLLGFARWRGGMPASS